MALIDKVFVKPGRSQKGNKFFTTKDYGGYLNAVIGSPAAWPGSLLANCTGAAWGCFAQQENDPNCRIGCAVGNNWYGNASSWIQYSKAQGYPIYDKPLLGGVVVWGKSGGYGHVGYITKVYSDGSFDTVESGWGASAIWWEKHYNANGYRAGYSLLGYIGSKKYNYIEKAPTPTPTPTKKFKVGDRVVINGDLYKSANAASPAGRVSNRTTYITRYAEGTKHPYNTTGDLGWMNESDIKLATDYSLKVGDKVLITNTGNGQSNGKGRTAYGVGWTRYIKKIYTGAAYPYQVGDSTGTTGFYKDTSLKKV